MAKKKGGVGRHVTKNVPRTFAPNLQQHRIWVPELKKFVRIRVTARGLIQCARSHRDSFA
jgi:large subunit ribosomal protein L28